MRESFPSRSRAVVARLARVAYAFVVMNYSAVAALPAMLFRKKVWR
jgi:hypothetical protein